MKPRTKAAVWRSGWLLLAAGALATTGRAQTSADSGGSTPHGVSTEEIVITAQQLEDSLPGQLARSGVKVDVIDGARITQGGYQDVSTALQNLAPGMFIMPYQGAFGYDQISLLGSRTEDVLFLIDGVRINNRLYASTPPLDTLPAGVVDHLEVLDGGQGLFYGTQAVAGVVNIVTRPFTAQSAGATSLGVDTNGARHVDAYFSDSSPFGQYVVYGSSDRSGGYRQFRDQDYQPSDTDRNRSYDVTTLGIKYAVDLTRSLRVEAGFQGTHADLDYVSPFRVARDVNMRREDIATVKVDWQATARLGLFVKAYYHNWHTSYDTYYNDLGEPGRIDVIYQDAFWGYRDRGINALGTYDIGGGLSAYFGADVQSYGGRDEVLVIDQHNETTRAGFAQLRYSPPQLPHLTLAAGARYNAPDVGAKATIWNVSGRYGTAGGLFVKTEVSTNFRLPTAEELFANDPEDERGNPALKPESSHSYNLSFGQDAEVLPGSRLHWEIAGFARDITNLIDYESYDDATGQSVFGNVPGKVSVRGAEGDVRGIFGPHLSADINYTYNHSRADGSPIDNIPTALLKADLDIHSATGRWGATATFSYTGSVSRPVGGVETPYGRYPLLNLSARFRPDTAQHQEIDLSISNVLNRQYGLPARGCQDVATDGPYECSSPYVYVSLAPPLTFSASYRYRL